MGITPCLPGADFEYALWICPYISRHLLSLNAQNFSIRGCKPEPPKFPSRQFHPCHKGIQINHLAVTLKGIV
ncbi:hypothetical protein, partial [Citrobacter braakii]|uniref:hypothetical protein n=1 Tax=Citrobacter braakii TaxID=57706 RepID=UPI001C7D4F25